MMETARRIMATARTINLEFDLAGVGPIRTTTRPEGPAKRLEPGPFSLVGQSGRGYHTGMILIALTYWLDGNRGN